MMSIASPTSPTLYRLFGPTHSRRDYMSKRFNFTITDYAMAGVCLLAAVLAGPLVAVVLLAYGLLLLFAAVMGQLAQ